MSVDVGAGMSNIFNLLKRYLWPVYMYKVELDSQWMVGTKSACDQERTNLLATGYHPDEVVVSLCVTTQAQLEKMPEFDGF